MARAWRWLSGVRRAVARSSCTSTAELDAIKSNAAVFNNPALLINAAAPASRSRYYSKEQDDDEVVPPVCEEEEEAFLITREDLAAITIQAFFRAHLARRAFRALKSLVRLQAVVRGACVRREARIAIHCMQALVRLQVRVRARQQLCSAHWDHQPPLYHTQN